MAQIRLLPTPINSSELLWEILRFEQSWLAAMDIEQSMAHVDEMIGQSLLVLERVNEDESRYDSPEDLVLAQLNRVLDHFYLEQSFSCATEQISDSLAHSLYYLIHFHTGENLTMTLLLNHLLLGLGFDSTIMVIEQQVMLKVPLSDHEYAVIDASCGDQYCYHSGDKEAVLPTLADADILQLDKFNLVQIFLSQQKMAFTRERQFDKALRCTDLLIRFVPNDPYQRRDRGFLLHQLDCFELALHDFKFFIDQCPHDPAAQMLEAQMEELDGSEQTVH